VTRKLRSRSSARSRLTASLLVLGMVAGACGGSSDSNGGGSEGGSTTSAEAATPTPGGEVAYGLEAETSGGWCLPEAQLAISGLQIGRAVYDTLTLPNADGDYVPYLAKSVTPNATFDKWTIELRDGVKFHDGTDLDSEVVKNNIDAFRGAYPARAPLLFIFVYENIDTVEVAGPLTVEVTTKTPWPAFPAYLYANGRMGIMAQAQLDDPDHCDENMIGTGPFIKKEWKLNDHLRVERNPDYWNQPYPYLDAIDFRPVPDAVQRMNSLEAGDLSIMHTNAALSIDTMRGLAESGDLSLVEGPQYAEVNYMLLNAARPPFDNILARRALAYAIDRDALREVLTKNVLANASGPFGPGSMGYLDDAGFPEFDLAKAKELVAQYKAETGNDVEFTITNNADPDSQAASQMWKEMAEKAGMKVDLKMVEQGAEIDDAIAGNFDTDLWRNHPGGDPDLQYVWWHSGSPVNFGKFEDPEIDRLLEEGRVETDPAKRTRIYEDMNRRFADQVWNIWSQWTLWVVASKPDVHGVLGPDLPDGSEPFPGLADGHQLTGIWIEG